METIRSAKVINNNDTDKLGKIQVRILPDMLDVKESDLPWVSKYSIGVGITSTNGVHEIPEIGSFIRVIIEDYPICRRIRYISDDYVEGLYIYSQATKITATELATQTYPQPSFTCYKDGTIDFHNSSTGEHGTFFKGGGYQLVDSVGNFFSNSKTKDTKIYNDKGYVSLKSDGTLELNGSAKQFVTWSELDDAFNLALTGYIAKLNLCLTSPTNVQAGNGAPLVFTAPALPTSVDLSSAKTTTIKTK